MHMFLLVALATATAWDVELACLDTAEWSKYHAAYEVAARATALEGSDRAVSRASLGKELLARTSNVTEVLSCNVGVVAGYYLLAHLVSQEVKSMNPGNIFGLKPFEHRTGLAYRLLQLALIFIFTLRNANRIPSGPAQAWGVTEHHIIPALLQMRRGQDEWLKNHVQRLQPISPSFRDPNLNIAIVSICAYPADRPLVLPKLTPANRETYANRHGYALRVHLEHPIIGAHGLGVQHAKLATVLAYLQSNEFDWVAWLDCDSIIMNMNRTLDSIIYQYTQKRAEAEMEAGLKEAKNPAPVCGEKLDMPDLLIGEWSDSWVTDDLREESLIRIRRGELAMDSSAVWAEAPQIGLVQGEVQGNQLEMDFGDAKLQAEIQWNITGNGAVELLWENGARWVHRVDHQSCREPCRTIGPGCDSQLLDPEVNLLITEEGWGLSSANWLIKRSAWSMKFLHDALTAAHVELQLFGDQDAMILHLMNRQALEVVQEPSLEDATLYQDPLDAHAAVIPQFELNAYDALNALTMECDAFVEGDLLVTFPQCKEAEGNDVFELAAEYANDDGKLLEPDAGAWWRRQESTPKWSRYSQLSSAALRIFGPRPLIREVYTQEQQLRKRCRSTSFCMRRATHRSRN
ncbi:unnamed protein product [Durusdinium trenchii]|uniref:Uncharacterized protein n=1 Tax=Durusdinium trenchii TaxID=1381693 RepID=A0ABP0IRW8_9DINO